jgi:hypothetical protein
VSGRAYQPSEYQATLVPWLKPVEMLDAKLGRITELFAPAAFHHAEQDPTTVPVVYRHHEEPVEVGHLVALERGTSWIKGRFQLQLYDNLVALYAAEQLEHGSPVSIEYTPVSTLNRIGLLDDVHWHIEANLNAIAVGIDRSADDSVDGGAKIVAIRDRPRPRRAAPSTTAAPRTLIRRGCGQVLAIR